MKGALDRGLASLRARAAWTRALLIAGIAVSAVTFISGSVLLVGEFGNRSARLLVASTPFQMTLGFAGLGSVAVFLATMILILLWIHRAHANLRAVGLEELTYSPGWAVGSFFVPIVNLFVPFRAMRELYNRSSGEPAHFAAITVADVNSWWSCYLVSNFIALFIAITTALGPTTGIHVVTPPGVDTGLALFANLLGIGASVLLYRIVAAVTRAQQSTTGVSEAFA